MQVRHREVFTSIQTEGAILPTDLLKRIFSGDSDLDGLKSKDYHLPEGEKLNEAINRSWNVLQGYWRSFLTGKEKLAEGDLGTTLTRERWLLPLFKELGYGRLLTHKAIEIENKPYPISHSWHKTPIHLVGCKVDLDRRMAKVAGAARSSPHSLVQELLNRSDDYLWAFLSNGARLRILRDNLSLTRQAYVEFDLETMMEGEIYSDFVLLWLLCHQSRVEADKPEESWIEKWSKTAQEQGTRALDQLRNAVEDAIKALGSGFVKHLLNWDLREKLKAGQLDKQDYYRQILRLIYRLLFLFVAEDRDMLFDPGSRPEEREFYAEHYSTTRLRRMAEKFRGTRHSDLYKGFQLVSEKLGNKGCSELGLPALGSFLFSKNKAIPDLENSEISNEDFLNAIRALAFILDQGTLRAVDYKNLGSEEFGSVYESLLELHPNLNADAGTFELDVAGGHERKITGSYYTPSSLVQCLLDSALDPVINEAIRKPNPEKAILDLKICDPASGSGHFLIAAAHRVARRLAAIRTGDEEPAPKETRVAIRDVISHCVYGVDLNPMAVELCKVALWMESLDPGKPLSFLDHKIQCGNSLLGTTPKLLADGIPSEAFRAIEEDDPKYCAELRRRNEQEKQGQMTMWTAMVAESHAAYGSLTDRYRSLDEMDDASVEAIAEKEKQYDRLLQSSNYQHSKLIADAWCAAFVWPKRSDAPDPITQDIYRKIQSLDLQPLRDTVGEVHQLSQKYRFFHWHLAFPDVFRLPSNGESAENNQTGWNGGFSVVLGNPPWETLEFKEKEWFAKPRPDISEAPNATVRRALINNLKTEDPILFDKYINEKRSSEALSHFIRNSHNFPLCARGKINTYSIFAENKRRILNPEGRVGTIVQTGIATDDTTKYFFQDLVDTNCLVSFYDFENSLAIFRGVHREQRFCLLTMSGQEKLQKSQSDFVFFAKKIEDLKDNNRHFNLSKEDFKILNPNTRTCPIFKNKRDAYITLLIYKNVDVLVKETVSGHDPWEVKFLQGLFNSASDSHLFSTDNEMKEDGYMLLGNVFQKNSGHALPLYEGKLTYQYDHRYSTYSGVSELDKKKGNSSEIKKIDKKLPDYLVQPRYWIKDEYFPNHDIRNWWLSYHRTCNVNNFRTSIASIIPMVAASDNLALIDIGGSAIKALLLLSIFNSFIFDFVVRNTITGRSLGFFVVKQLPFIKPEVYGQTDVFFRGKLSKAIGDRALELTYTASDLDKFAKDYGYSGALFQWNEERRFIIRCELDAVYFHLYGVKSEDIEYVLESFPIVKRKDEEKYGEYKTKKIILNIYNEMADALHKKILYKSKLDPPLLDPSITHFPNEGNRMPGLIWNLNELIQTNPIEKIINVELPKECVIESCDLRRVSKFRILQEDERITRECQVVIIRHPELRRGAEKISIAAGKFSWAEQRDVETGKPFILITLRTKGVPVRLKLSKEEWKQFQPMAVLEK